MRVVACLFACLISTLGAYADPASYSRIVAFGDSLSDNGNLFNNTPPGTPGRPAFPYFDGRFSNGPTWIELLSNPAQSSNPDSSMNRFWGGFGFGPPFNVTGNVNAAIGGAQATGGVIPSVQTQIGLYQLVGGTFGPNDLVSVQGGANDFFNFFATNPTPTVAALQIFATQVGVNEAANVSSLIQAGAKTLLVSNLPNIGATPSFNGTAAGAAGGQFATTTYNAALNQGVQQLAALNPRVNLVQMDWFSALNVILANPAAFGFTNVKDACTASLACILSNAQGFLFWDGVHPTAAGHQLLAEYAALLLSTEQTGRAVGALGQVGLSTRLDASDILFRRGDRPIRLGRWRENVRLQQ